MTKPAPLLIVTGVSGGIGSRVARGLISEGRDVVGIDILEPGDADLCGTFLRADLRNSEACLGAVRDILKLDAPIYGIVHCAGMYPIRGPADYSVGLWDEVHAVNVRSIFQIALGLKERLIEFARVVLISSGAAHLGSRDPAYSASKAALMGLMRSLATNWAADKILVNAVCPGPIVSPMSARMPEESKLKYRERILLGEFGTVDDVWFAVRFLLGEENRHLTGMTIDVNGGLYMR